MPPPADLERETRGLLVLDLIDGVPGVVTHGSDRAAVVGAGFGASAWPPRGLDVPLLVAFRTPCSPNIPGDA